MAIDLNNTTAMDIKQAPAEQSLLHPNNYDIWGDSVSDFFGTGPCNNANYDKHEPIPVQPISLADAFDKIADFHEKPLEKKIDEPKKDCKIKPQTQVQQQTKNKMKYPSRYNDDPYQEALDNYYYEQWHEAKEKRELEFEHDDYDYRDDEYYHDDEYYYDDYDYDEYTKEKLASNFKQ